MVLWLQSVNILFIFLFTSSDGLVLNQRLRNVEYIASRNRLAIIHKRIHSKSVPLFNSLCALTAKTDDSTEVIEWPNILSNPSVKIAIGALALLLLLLNRVSMELELITDSQRRADILSVLAASALILNGLNDQDIELKSRDKVTLFGLFLKTPLIDSALSSDSFKAMSWLLNALVDNTIITSAHVILDDRFVGRVGIIGYNDEKNSELSYANKPILQNALTLKKEEYLPDLQILPGKVEFTYLPINAQSVLILPFVNLNGGIVLTTNQAKALKVQDIKRLRALITVFEAMR